MLCRKEQESTGILLPQEWSKEVESTLFSLYLDQCKKEGKSFEVYGLTYPNEVFIGASFLDQKHLSGLPVTYMASADFEDKEHPKKTFDLLIDSIGIFFDNYFNSPKEDHYASQWMQTKLKKKVFYYKVSREVLSLTLEANKLLESK